MWSMLNRRSAFCLQINHQSNTGGTRGTIHGRSSGRLAMSPAGGLRDSCDIRCPREGWQKAEPNSLFSDASTMIEPAQKIKNSLKSIGQGDL